jgi:hypothetical protein
MRRTRPDTRNYPKQRFQDGARPMAFGGLVAPAEQPASVVPRVAANTPLGKMLGGYAPGLVRPADPGASAVPRAPANSPLGRFLSGGS